MSLIAVLWAVYLSECFVRWRPGDWVFRRTGRRTFSATNHADVTFLNERFAFAWTSVWPADPAFRAAGDNLDVESCRARVAAALRQTRGLRASATALFLLLLVAFPVLIVSARLLSLVLPFVALVLLAWGSTLLAFFRSYRRVHGARPPLEIWLTHALSPLSLIGSPAAVVVDALSDVHPVAVAGALCGDEEFLRVARPWHVDSAVFREKIAQIAARRGLEEALTAPPPIVEQGVTQFCRRCHATYLAEAVSCADCRGMSLSSLQTSRLLLESSPRNDDQQTICRTGGPHDVRTGDRRHAHRRARRRPGHTRRGHRRQAS